MAWKRLNRPKYHNTKITVGEITFDSKKEAERYTDLCLMAKAGLISDLRCQVTYTLIPSQKVDGKCKERACKYKADFVYKENGKTIVEDVKGYKTKEYRIKKKLMLFIHGIEIKEV